MSGRTSVPTRPSPIADAAERELLITRVFDAPRELVFKAWTDPRHITSWWGPANFPVTQMDMEVRPGGDWRGCLRSVAGGRELRHRGVFREVVPPERLVFTFAWEAEGERGRETLVTLTFAAEGDKTLMTLRQEPFLSVEDREEHRGDWIGAFDRLHEHMASNA